MTLPCQRTTAVIAACDFLLRLASPYNGGIKGIRREVRDEARRLLKHLPTRADLMMASEAVPHLFSDPYGDVDVSSGTTQQTAAEPRETSTAWMNGPVLVDPPSGWRYGFPRLWDRSKSLREFLTECGYPEKELGFACEHCRYISAEQTSGDERETVGT
jgi:hypothetical protein